jgi:hypothetical protein
MMLVSENAAGGIGAGNEIGIGSVIETFLELLLRLSWIWFLAAQRTDYEIG